SSRRHARERGRRGAPRRNTRRRSGLSSNVPPLPPSLDSTGNGSQAPSLPSSHSREAHTVVPVLHTSSAEAPRYRDTVKGPSQVFGHFLPSFDSHVGAGF